VSAVNTSGESDLTSAVIGTTYPDIPAIPDGLVITGRTNTKLAMIWNEAARANGYKVYSSSAELGVYSLADTLSNTQYTNTGLSPDETWWYKVSAINDTGESGLSDAELGITTKPIPTTPTGLAVTNETTDTISMNWAVSTWANSYNVYRSDTELGVYTKVGTTTGNTYDDTALAMGDTWWYKVSGENEFGESAVSASTDGTTLVEEFTITVDTSLVVGTDVYLPITGIAGTVRVDWGDGDYTIFANPGDKVHTYAVNGSYTIRITGGLTAFGSLVNKDVYISVGAWNLPSITSFYGAFYNAGNLTTVPDELPINLTIMEGMFYGATAFNYDISVWDTSNITNMRGLLFGCTAFNRGISIWDTSNVTDMSYLLFNATTFDYALGNWTMDSVADLEGMLGNSGLSESNYSQTLVGWSNQGASLPVSQALGATGMEYSNTVYGGTPYDNAVDARAFLVLATGSGGKGWTIVGDSLV